MAMDDEEQWTLALIRRSVFSPPHPLPHGIRGLRSNPCTSRPAPLQNVCAPPPPPPRALRVSASNVSLPMGSQSLPPPLRDSRPPGVVKQDKSSGGSVDTTKTRSGPQRVRMSSGERPIGAAKGKQPNTEALCHPPPLRASSWERVSASTKKTNPQSPGTRHNLQRPATTTSSTTSRKQKGKRMGTWTHPRTALLHFWR